MRSRLLFAAAFYKPEFWLDKAGASVIWVVTAIIFAESGLFFGFFLPGDSMLFLTGFLSSPAAKKLTVPGGTYHSLAPVVDHLQGKLPLLLILFFLAAVAGDQVGYLFGRKVGPALFSRQDSRLFKQSHVQRASAFLEKNGPKTIFLARFVPIVRTFAPVVAGVGHMRYRTFLIYNLLGGFCWAVGVTLLGHQLGTIEFFRKNIEYTIVAVIAISLLPVAIEVIRHRRGGSTGRQPAHAVTSDPGADT